MPTLGTNAVTLADIRSRLDPDGMPAQVIEVLNLENSIVADALWKEGNLPTGNVTTQRTSLPSPTKRRLNQGVAKSKSTTAQITDTCCLLEANSEVDVDVLAIQNDGKAYRLSEDLAHAEGFRQAVAELMIYGNTSDAPEEFNGLECRYNKLNANKGTPGYQIISAGGSGSDNTSAWLVGWSEKGVCGIYPKGSTAGLDIKDMGIQRVTDSSGNPYYAYCTNMKWKPGLAVVDHRYAARVANIDVSDLITFGAETDTSADLIKYFILAQNRVPKMTSGVKWVWYVNELVYSWLQIMLTHKKNVYITRQELMNKMPELYINGIVVHQLDCLINSESKVS